MANSLVSTVFQTGPDDSLAAIDVLKNAGGSGTITNVQPLNTEAAQIMGGGFGSTLENSAKAAINKAKATTANAVSGLKDAVSQVTAAANSVTAKAKSIINSAPADLIANKKELTNRVLSAANEISSGVENAVRALPSNVSDLVLKSVPPKSDLMCTVGDAKTKVSVQNVKSVNAVGRAINEITGEKIFTSKDNSAVGGLLGGLVGAASDMGIPGVFESISSTLTDNKVAVAAIKATLPHVINSSDISTLKAITKTPAGKMIEAIAPGTVSKITKTYTIPKLKSNATKLDHTLDAVTNILSDIKPGWNSQKRSGDTNPAIRIVDLMDGSDDWKTMIKKTSAYAEEGKKLYGIAAKLKKQNVGDALKKDFPKSNLSSLKKTKNTVPNILPTNKTVVPKTA